MKHECQLCNSEMIQLNNQQSQLCMVCGGVFEDNRQCSHGHYICDNCSDLSFEDFSEKYLVNSSKDDPINLLETLMLSPKLPLQGDGHIFLVTSVLLTCYYNRKKEYGLKKQMIRKAKKNALHTTEGLFENMGFSGIAVASAQFVHLIKYSDMDSFIDKKLSNTVFAEVLTSIAQYDAPRCAKRESYETIMEVLNFIRKNFEIIFTHHGVQCKFSSVIQVCIKKKCPYYAVKHGEDIL